MHDHPYVSEDHEGKPWFEWAVAAVVALAVAVAALGYQWNRCIPPVAAAVTGLLRLILRERSPWKVRSVAFDAFIGIALGIGLLAVHFSVGLLG